MISAVVKMNQPAFLKGRNIMEGVLVLHETLHQLHKKNTSVVLFKFDFEKAYGKVKRPFLYQVLQMKGFPRQWNGWIMKIVRGGQVGINVNGVVGLF